MPTECDGAARSPLGLSRRSFLAALGAFGAAALGAPAAWAGEEWCPHDPPLRLRVEGRPVTVNVTFAVPKSQRHLLRLARASGQVHGDTVVIRATVPATRFKVWARIPALHRAAGDPEAVYAGGRMVALAFPHLARRRGAAG